MNDSDDTTSLGDFLVQLAQEGERLQSFLRNPERAMADAGLSYDDRDLVLGGNVDEIYRRIAEQLEGATAVLIVYFPNWPIVHW